MIEVFKPHHKITFSLLRSIFEKLAHSSIMRLNEQSMNKLFDLMVMVVKYQLQECAKVSDLITITDNHLLSVPGIIQQIATEASNSDSEEGKNNLKDSSLLAVQMVHKVREQFLRHYANNLNNQFDGIQLQLMRYSLLNFFRNIHTRVSIFLREGIQNAEGRFVIPTDQIKVECECQIPGVIRYFGPDNTLQCTETYDTGTKYLVLQNVKTMLGLNM